MNCRSIIEAAVKELEEEEEEKERKEQEEKSRRYKEAYNSIDQQTRNEITNKLNEFNHKEFSLSKRK